MGSVKDILNFIRPKAKTRIWHDGKLLMQFESKESKEIIFIVDDRAELKTFINSEHENS